MRKIYWRPRAVSRTALSLIALLSIIGLFLVEHMPVEVQRPYHTEKIAAAKLAKRAMEAIKLARVYRGYEIDSTVDPTESGLIGVGISTVTSVTGHLMSKQTSINPNFAAVIIDMLKRAGVKDGDTVAVGVSGSFPAINICVYAALETLHLDAIIISSASGSQWGANLPNLLWIDMERILAEQEIFSLRSVAASIGGDDDQGLGISEEGRLQIIEKIDQNGLPLITSINFEDAVNKRMDLYRINAGAAPIKCYINVGGGAVSVGTSEGKRLFDPGLNTRIPSGIYAVDGIMPRFIREDTPIIHMSHIIDLAERYQLPVAPTRMEEVGSGGVYVGIDKNRWLATAVLTMIVLSLYSFIRSDIGFRILNTSAPRKELGHPEPMV